MKTVLFVCSQNRLRSPTAEQIFAHRSDIEVASAGTNHDADTPLSVELVRWADMIVVMEKTHRSKVQRRFRHALGGTRVVCLDIPDDYDFMEPGLVRLLEARMARHLPSPRSRDMPDPLRLARGTPDQAGAIRDLTLRAYTKWLPITLCKPRPMTADYDAALREHRFDCLWEGERLVGLIETAPEGDELLIVNVAVEPDCQGRGFGIRLMRHAETLAGAAGLRGTRLYTNKLMAENIALYSALGYAFEKETHHDHGVVAVHMKRPIS